MIKSKLTQLFIHSKCLVYRDMEDTMEGIKNVLNELKVNHTIKYLDTGYFQIRIKNQDSFTLLSVIK